MSKWIVLLRIEGVGRALSDAEIEATGSDGRYAFCSSVPSNAPTLESGESLYQDLLAAVPDLLSEHTSELGGLPELGALSVELVDVGDRLTRLLSFREDAGLTGLTLDLTPSGTTVEVLDASRIPPPDAPESLIYVGSEAMRVDAIDGTTVTVKRGFLGTDAVRHDSGDVICDQTPYVQRRRCELSLDREDLEEEELLGSYLIDKVAWSQDLNVWQLSARSQLKFLDRLVPRQLERLKVLRVRARDGQRPEVDFDRWGLIGYTLGSNIYLSNGDEILTIQIQGSTGIVLRRGVLDTEQAELSSGQAWTWVLVAEEEGGNFRWNPSYTEDTLPLAETWRSSAHWVDLALCILTSSADPYDGLLLMNHDFYGNWSVLPPGFGLGVPAALIDWSSWLRAKALTPDAIFPQFVLGPEARPFSEILEEWLTVVGGYLRIVDGKIGVVLSRLLPIGQAATDISDSIVRTSIESGRSLLELSLREVSVTGTGATSFRVGRSETSIAVKAGAFASTYGQRGLYSLEDSGEEIKSPSGDPRNLDLYVPAAQRRLYRTRHPPLELEARLIEDHRALAPGHPIALSLDEVPANGRRGVSGLLGVMLDRELRLEATHDGGLGLTVNVRAQMSPRARVGTIAPSGEIGIVAGSVVTIASNRHTDYGIADSGLPFASGDGLTFAAGDELQLLTPGGSPASSATQVLTARAANVLTLDGDFGGDLAVGLILTLAPYGASADVARASFGSLSTQVSGEGVTDPPFACGDA